MTPLHLCAEFNSVACAKVLIAAGADVNARSGVDAEGIGGQTPLFHCVNSIHNFCRQMMELLVDSGASLDVRVPVLLWGESFPWETIPLDASPVSCAQCGAYRQFHRSERDTWSNGAFLHRARHGADPPLRNIPNRYLAG